MVGIGVGYSIRRAPSVKNASVSVSPSQISPRAIVSPTLGVVQTGGQKETLPSNPVNKTMTIPSDWQQHSGIDPEFGVFASLSVPPGYSFGFTGSEWTLHNAQGENWDYSTSVFPGDKGLKNYYTGGSRRVWYQQFLNGDFSGDAGKTKLAEIISVSEYPTGTSTYLAVTLRYILASKRVETHYLYVQNDILHILKPAGVQDVSTSSITKNMGMIFASLSSKTVK